MALYRQMVEDPCHPHMGYPIVLHLTSNTAALEPGIATNEDKMAGWRKWLRPSIIRLQLVRYCRSRVVG